MNNDKKLLVRFFFLSYVIAWVLWLPLVLSKRGLGLLPVDMPLWSMVPGTFAPTLTAFLVHRWCCGNWRAVDFFKGWRNAWIGIVIAPTLLLLGEIIIPTLVLAKAPPARLHWKALLPYPYGVFYWSILLTSPLGEEPGWRGYALPRLQSMLGPFRATLLLGVLWAFWHLPLFLVKGWTGCGFMVYVMVVIGWSLIITFAFNLSGGSVIVAVIAHSALNACNHFDDALLGGVPTRTGISENLVVAVSLLVLGGLLVVLTRGRLGRPRLAAAAEEIRNPEVLVDGHQNKFE
jgi:membrane protease YdiL (CAAX protease family)